MQGETAKSIKNRGIIPVVDIFAGAGGLGEGFASYAGKSAIKYQVRLSIESDVSACETLRLRAFFHNSSGNARRDYYRFVNGELDLPELYGLHRELFNEIEKSEVWEVSLGGKDFSEEELHIKVENTVKGYRDWILIGGPPCQAYSTAGRARNKGIEGYDPECDERHFLYREYLRIISRHWPSVFVMENVPGILSSTAGGNGRIFDRIHEDLHDPGAAEGPPSGFGRHGIRRHLYHIRPLDPEVFYKLDLFGRDFDRAKDFVVSSERHGVPQSRRRVILVGVRDDITDARPTLQPSPGKPIPARSVIMGLPPIRSGVSKTDDLRKKAKSTDENELWRQALMSLEKSRWLMELDQRGEVRLCKKLKGLAVYHKTSEMSMTLNRGGELVKVGRSGINYRAMKPYKNLYEFIADHNLSSIRNHSTREHMVSDLHRYLFVSVFSQVHGRSPKLQDFPTGLLPKHKSVSKALSHGNFADRFRVQLWDEPANTVVSHISKDGHYFIHPDPKQCRSLTVREAARLQTFPDNYVFCGSRGEQYRQVGNAVPPLLGREIAASIADLFVSLIKHSAKPEPISPSEIQKDRQIA